MVGFVGVDPAHRGHGYAPALLVAVTSRLEAAGAERVRADTDFTNAPMIAAFERAGWRPWATRMVLHRP
jgi:RimJ/RimL family protein N-acetyltransferase